MMKITDVAREAGVSPTTVSLVMNQARSSRVSDITRKKVLETIKRLDYRPNLIARRLVSGKTNSIGLYIPFKSPIFDNYALIRLVAGIQDAVNERRHDLILFSTGRDVYWNRHIRQITRQKTVDGLIIVNTRYTTQYFINKAIRELNATGFRYVLVNYYWGKANINYVGVDYENDSLKAISHLIELGHRNIALITGLETALVTPKIIDGYKAALRRHHIGVRKKWIAPADYDPQKAYETTQRLIRENPSVTALFVADYEMAFASLRAIKEMGLKIPGDISLVSYIDTEISNLVDPPLTAVRLPQYDMGRKAVELLLDPGGERGRVILETEIIVRGSTAERQKSHA
jgi:DNA-binding LacI/PurR family transcriptional regulator